MIQYTWNWLGCHPRGPFFLNQLVGTLTQQFKKTRQLAVRCFSRLASRRIEISSWQRMTVDGSEIRRLPVDVEKIPFYA